MGGEQNLKEEFRRRKGGRGERFEKRVQIAYVIMGGKVNLNNLFSDVTIALAGKCPTHLQLVELW